MARYSKAFKQRAVARLLPPEASPVDVVSREIGISSDTLERWRSQALAGPSSDKTWTAAASLRRLWTRRRKTRGVGNKASTRANWKSGAAGSKPIICPWKVQYNTHI